MKIKHYLTKAERTIFESDINHKRANIIIYAHNNDEYNFNNTLDDIYTILDYIMWCGFDYAVINGNFKIIKPHRVYTIK